MDNKIKEKRKEKKYTQEQLSRLVGVSRQSIIAIESGKYKPSLELAHKIAKQFDCMIEDIFIFDRGGAD